MCDTFVIPPSLSASGHWIFAKNSDREPNEAQQWMYIPAGTRDRDQVHTSFIDIDHPRDYHGMWLSRPFHLWGGEMGVNDHGLAIGNEAVFTRIPIAKQNDGLTGMDMIRLALEKCRYAKQAVDQICHYVETYGQDACGGYRNRNFYYHNSFIVCDPREAFVLETAGRHWVYRRLDGFYAISNQLTIGQAWDGISDDAISYARSRNRCRGTEDFDFAAAYTAPLMSRLAMARQRRETCMTQATVRSAGSKLTIADAIAILRSHAGGNDFEPRRGAMNSVCLHATGLLTPSQTTGSLVAELRPETHATIWATGSASPCLGMFKPFFTAVPIAHEAFMLSPEAKPGNAYWWRWERWHRQALRKYREAKQAWVNIALPAETAWLKTWEGKSPGETLPIELGKISDDAIENSLRILADMAETLSHQQPDPRGLLYRYAWRQWNKAAGISHG